MQWFTISLSDANDLSFVWIHATFTVTLLLSMTVHYQQMVICLFFPLRELKLICRACLYAVWDFPITCEGEEMILTRQTQKGEEGWERRWEDDRVADWSKGFLSPPAMPSVHARLSPLVFEHTTHNALCLWFPQLHRVSGVHLFCIKVRGKGTMGKSRLACSSLKGYHQTRAHVQSYGWSLHILLMQQLWLHSWLAQHTRVSVSPCRANSANQLGASGRLPTWSKSVTGCISNLCSFASWRQCIDLKKDKGQSSAVVI